MPPRIFFRFQNRGQICNLRVQLHHPRPLDLPFLQFFFLIFQKSDYRADLIRFWKFLFYRPIELKFGLVANSRLLITNLVSILLGRAWWPRYEHFSLRKSSFQWNDDCHPKIDKILVIRDLKLVQDDIENVKFVEFRYLHHALESGDRQFK